MLKILMKQRRNFHQYFNMWVKNHSKQARRHVFNAKYCVNIKNGLIKTDVLYKN